MRRVRCQLVCRWLPSLGMDKGNAVNSSMSTRRPGRMVFLAITGEAGARGLGAGGGAFTRSARSLRSLEARSSSLVSLVGGWSKDGQGGLIHRDLALGPLDTAYRPTHAAMRSTMPASAPTSSVSLSISFKSANSALRRCIRGVRREHAMQSTYYLYWSARAAMSRSMSATWPARAALSPSPSVAVSADSTRRCRLRDSSTGWFKPRWHIIIARTWARRPPARAYTASRSSGIASRQHLHQ